MKSKIKLEAEKLGLDACGITNNSGKSIIVCLFPYYINIVKGNISRYAVVPDYHKIAKGYLEKLAENCRLTDYEIYADVSPYDERKLAFDAGLGKKGRNGLLINEKYGSYVFIGLIVLNSLVLESDKASGKECLGCGKCIESCPGGAITGSGFIQENCLSEITQKKGNLSAEEKELIIKSGCVWGCDICSEVCPMNNDIAETPLPEFKENIISSLNLEELEGLSNKGFLKKFHDRAFTWRGKNVLIRNCGVIEDCLPEDNL